MVGHDNTTNGMTVRPTRREALGLLLSGASAGAAVLLPGAANAETWRERAGRLLHDVAPWTRAAAPTTATLLVGGPSGGSAAQIADLIAPILAPTLLGPSTAPDPSADERVGITLTGGLDGVTAANAFEARANPDGSTALIVPGHAALAWIAGDPRVHFDAGTWVPVLATLSPVAVVGRAGTASLARGRTVVLGGSNPAGPVLPALVALTLLGVDVHPRFDLDREEDAEAALRAGAIDAMVVSGRDVPTRIAGLGADGFPAYFSFGPNAGSPTATREPALASVETFDERFARQTGAAPAGPLAGALRASAAAARLDTATVLPQLAPAAAVARWRDACDQAVGSLALQSATRAQSIAPAPAPVCVDAVRATVPSEDQMLALHRLLAGRWGWQPV